MQMHETMLGLCTGSNWLNCETALCRIDKQKNRTEESNEQVPVEVALLCTSVTIRLIRALHGISMLSGGENQKCDAGYTSSPPVIA